MNPQEISDLDLAFPASVKSLMPDIKIIPKEFFAFRGKWPDLVSEWFFNGLPEGTQFIPKPGIDKKKALRHIKTILGSWEPKHEDKTAAVAYLLSHWFEDVIKP